MTRNSKSGNNSEGKKGIEGTANEEKREKLKNLNKSLGIDVGEFINKLK